MDIGVVIGRFQIDKLHDGHRELIRIACTQNKKVIIFLGVPAFGLTKRNPLDYQSREKMIKEAFPEVVVLPLRDREHDEDWSKQIDQAIQTVYPNATEVTLFGGTDSFIPHYKGKWTTKQIDPDRKYSDCPGKNWRATQRREAIGNEVRPSEDFRAGVIYAVENGRPGALPCVDIGMTRNFPELGRTELLLGRKPGEAHWRLPGGFIDPTDKSAEDAAKRELAEETGMGSEAQPQYLGSYLVDEWRLRGVTEKKIMTFLYHIPYCWGAPKGDDDLEECKFWDISDLPLIYKGHQPLVDRVVQFTQEKK